ncbi:hypothetical protein, conserved [Angomonas deanei]|uniref:IPT/TIG domain containing protein n=1 Tax=Angomonas deanei TaxID=59799 RepID=A0A7G2CM12_9TRYP|nr:hypothetical protein, conserved [Angomonas deanei]
MKITSISDALRRPVAACAAVMLFLATASGAPAATSGSCKKGTSNSCVDGSTLTITGTGFDSTLAVTIGWTTSDNALIKCLNPTTTETSFTCTLNVATNYKGVYPVEMGDNHIGSILVGTFYQQDFDRYTTTWDPNSRIVSTADGPFTVGKKLTIYGTFEDNTEYEVLLYNEQEKLAQENIEDGSQFFATCENAAVDHVNIVSTVVPNAITCTLSKRPMAMGRYGVIVRNKATLAIMRGSGALEGFDIQNTDPVITNGLGDCALNSSLCKTGAILSVNGSYINVRQPYAGSSDESYAYLSFGFDASAGDSKSISCSKMITGGKGRNGQANCTLKIGSGVPHGMYPVYLTNQLGDNKATEISEPYYVGSLLVGAYYHYDFVGFNATMKRPNLIAKLHVSGHNSTYPTIVKSGETLLILGTFDENAVYEVLMYYSKQDIADISATVPTCTSLQITSNRIECTIFSKPSIMGPFKFLVRDVATGWILPGSTSLTDILISSSDMAILTGVGDCAGNSTLCTEGALLTFQGQGLNTVIVEQKGQDTLWFAYFTIGFLAEAEDKRSITCKTIKTAGRGRNGNATCQLSFAANTPVGMYPVYLQNQIGDDANMKSAPQYIGAFLYGNFMGTGSILPGFYPEASVKFPNGDADEAETLYVSSRGGGSVLAFEEVMEIFGRFDATATYEVIVYNSEEGGSDDGPTCTVVTVNSNKVTCSLWKKPSHMGLFKILVRDKKSGWILRISPNVRPFLLNSRPPVDVNVTVICPEGSTACGSGDAVLNITAAGLNTHTPPKGSSYDAYTRVVIGMDETIEDKFKFSCQTIAHGGGGKGGFVTCRLASGANATTGTYPIYIQNMLDTKGTWGTRNLLGSIMFNRRNRLDSKAFWLAPDKTTYMYNVTMAAPSNLRDNSYLTFFGHFNASATYNVTFGKSYAMTCDVVSVSTNAVRCLYNSNGQAVDSGDAFPLLNDAETTGRLTRDARTLGSNGIILYPPTPIILSATGECAEDSTKCRSGSKLTFRALNFDGKNIDQSRFVFSDSKGSIKCEITKVTDDSLTCTLVVVEGTKGRFLVTFQKVVNKAGTWFDPPVAAGELTIGMPGEKGWLGAATSTKAVHTRPVNRATFICTIVFAVLFAVALITLIVVCLCCQVSRKSARISRNVAFVNQAHDMETKDAHYTGTVEKDSFGNNTSASLNDGLSSSLYRNTNANSYAPQEGRL